MCEPFEPCTECGEPMSKYAMYCTSCRSPKNVVKEHKPPDFEQFANLIEKFNVPRKLYRDFEGNMLVIFTCKPDTLVEGDTGMTCTFRFGPSGKFKNIEMED